MTKLCDQARHQSQPSAIRATPATQNEGRCEQVPRLPRKVTVDVAKCHACHAKCRQMVCDKGVCWQSMWQVVCEKLCVCVTKFVLKNGVWQSCVWASCVWQSCVWASCVWQSCVWASCVWKRVSDKVCVERLCVCVSKLRVTKLCVSKLCVK